MASIQKFKASEVSNQIRHIERTIENPSNEDIDKEKISEDYLLSPDREMTSFDYYKQRLSEVYVYKRADVNTLCGWVITAPQELKKENEEAFFKSCYEFLNNRYGEKNVVSCAVHKDESGQPHMHYLFIPVVEDKKHKDYDGKVCADNLITQRELRNFHPDLQRHLDNEGIEAKIMTGITKRQGRNISVKELKQNREIEQQIEQTKQIDRWSSPIEQTKQIDRWSSPIQTERDNSYRW